MVLRNGDVIAQGEAGTGALGSKSGDAPFAMIGVVALASGELVCCGTQVICAPPGE